MYKYTPKKSILRSMRVPRTVPRWWDAEWHKLSEIIGSRCYMEKMIFRKHYKDCVFYSPTIRREVPLNGYLFSASLFNEEEVL